MNFDKFIFATAILAITVISLITAVLSFMDYSSFGMRHFLISGIFLSMSTVVGIICIAAIIKSK